MSRYDGVTPYLNKCKTSRAKSVLLGLWTFASIGEDNSKIWPSTEAIARRLGMAVRSVTRALLELETIGAFTKIGGARSTERVLHMCWDEDVAANPVLEPANSGATAANPVRKNVAANPVRQEDKPGREPANPVRVTANSGGLMSIECPSCPTEGPSLAAGSTSDDAQTTLSGVEQAAPKRDREQELWDHYHALRADALAKLGRRRTTIGFSARARGRVRGALKHIRETLVLNPDETLGTAKEFIGEMVAMAVAENDADRLDTRSALFATGWIDPWMSRREGFSEHGKAKAKPKDPREGALKAQDYHREGEGATYVTDF